MPGSNSEPIKSRVNKLAVFSFILAVAAFASIWVVMVLYVEWDGNKPGGWGYQIAGFATVLFSCIAAFITYQITYGVGNLLSKK